MNLIKKLVVAGCCAIAFGACKKDDNGPTNILSYNLDGVLKAAKPDAYYYPDHSVMIDGGDGPDDITIFADADLGVGTFHIGQLQDKVAGMYINWDSAIIFESDTGTLVIKSLAENHISGTFNFRAVNGPFNKQITKGFFDAKMSSASLPVDTTNYNESTATVAGKAIQMRKLKLQQEKRVKN